MKHKTVIIFAIISTVLFIACQRSHVTELVGRITFVSGDVLLNSSPCTFGAAVKAGDTISTGTKSAVVVQFGQTSVISLKENSSFILSTLTIGKEVDEITIKQKIGSSFNKIVKKGTHYSLETPTSVAAVRGTSFSCIVSEKGSAIKLSSGKVKVVPIIQGEAKEAESVEIDAGKKIEISTEGISAPVELSKSEEKEMKALDKIALIPEVEKETTIEELKKKPEDERPVIVPVEILQVLEVSETAEEKPTITLKDIEKKYGSISVIETIDGNKYTGAFSQEGAKMKIFTTEGTIAIPSSKISRVSRYKETK